METSIMGADAHGKCCSENRIQTHNSHHSKARGLTIVLARLNDAITTCIPTCLCDLLPGGLGTGYYKTTYYLHPQHNIHYTHLIYYIHYIDYVLCSAKGKFVLFNYASRAH